MHILVNTGGGDAPGLNAVIRAVTLSALRRGWKVTGIKRGYHGLLADDKDGLVDLTVESLGACSNLTAKLHVASDPPDALVRLDGQPVGTTPIDSMSLGPGRHERRLQWPLPEPRSRPTRRSQDRGSSRRGAKAATASTTRRWDRRAESSGAPIQG